MRKILSGALILALTLGMFVGCAAETTEPDMTPEVTTTDSAVTEPEILRAAVVLNGPISDMGWNAAGYAGIKAIEETYDAEIAFKENITTSDMEEALRGFADAGYNVVFAHGSQFTDAIKVVAKSYPETMFFMINGSYSEEPNLISVEISEEQEGFLAGAAAALMSKSGKIGFVGGEELPPIMRAGQGFEQGAKYINPDIDLKSTYTGSFSDVPKAKETSLAMINQGADVVVGWAAQATLGVIEACQEKGVLSVGVHTDQNELAPDNIFISVIKDATKAYTAAIDSYLSKNLVFETNKMGVAQGLVFLSPYYETDKISAETKEKLQACVDGLSDGTITVEYKK